MSTTFPTSLDSLTNPTPTSNMSVVLHSDQHINANDAIEALETKVWITNSTDVSSLDYMKTRLTTKWDILAHNGTNLVRQPVGTNWYMLVADSAQASWLNYISPSSWGTVTDISVVPTNWFTWSVANPTTTPAITLTTSITGVLKGNWTAISSAVAGTDYYNPGWTDVAVADGWTGVSTLTAYAPIFWGTTWTWAVQSWTVGAAWQVLTSNGAGALPTMQNIGIKKRQTAVQTMVNPWTVSTINTTTYWTTVTFEWWLVIGYINGVVAWVDCNGTIWVDWSPDNSSWTTIISATAFAYSGNSFSAWIISPVEWAIIAPGYIRMFASTSGTSVTTGTTLWTTYFRY